jgi:hypothetical protein
MKNTKKQKNLIFLLSIILIFTIVWVVSNVYHSAKSSTIEIPLAEEIIPIEGTFDYETVELIKARKRIEVSNDIITLTEEIQNEIESATSSSDFLEDEEEINAGTESADFEL